MKKLSTYLVFTLFALSMISCGKKEEKDKLYVDELFPLYESTEVTEENVLDYFILEEVEGIDIFGEKTGEKNLILRNKDGYFPEPKDNVAIRVTYGTTSIQNSEGSENSDYYQNERDIYLIGHEEIIETTYYEENGNVYETEVVDFTIEKVMGNVISYNKDEIDRLVTTDESGNKCLTVWIDECNCFVLDEDTIEDTKEFYKILYMNLIE